MSKFYTGLRQCRKFGQGLLVGVLCLTSAYAPECPAQKLLRGGRKPANYVPNDDVIAVPVDAEISFYEKHIVNDKTWSEKSQVQKQIAIWQENELMAQRYRLDTQSGQYYVPSSEEKWVWMQRSYFRYLKKKGEDPLKQDGQNMWRQWTASDEVNSIDEMEAAFRATTKVSAVGKPLPNAFQEKVTKTKRFRMQFQPRVEQGLLIVKATGPWFDARAWVAANGETEMNIQRTFETNTRVMMNYYAHSGQYLSAVDQNLGRGFSARFTSSWDPNNADINAQRNQTTQLMYGAEF